MLSGIVHGRNGITCLETTKKFQTRCQLITECYGINNMATAVCRSAIFVPRKASPAAADYGREVPAPYTARGVR